MGEMTAHSKVQKLGKQMARHLEVAMELCSAFSTAMQRAANSAKSRDHCSAFSTAMQRAANSAKSRDHCSARMTVKGLVAEWVSVMEVRKVRYSSTGLLNMPGFLLEPVAFMEQD
jgi:hypothetical protein